MNKVHKTVWNQTLGQWVVASELVKGQSKSKTLKVTATIKEKESAHGTFKYLGGLVVGAGLALSLAPAFAATCTTSGGIRYCEQSTANEVLNYDETGLTVPIYVQGTSILGGEAQATLTLNDSSITGAASGHGILVRGEGASLVLNGTNSVTLNNTANDTAILVMGNYGSGGDASIVVNDRLDINVNHAGMTTADGLETHGVNSSIIHHGQGRIETNGGNAIWADASNRAEVIIDGSSVDLVVSGDSNNGIKVSSQEAVVDISNTSITTSGTSANGIFARGNNGEVNVNVNNSTIEAAGYDAAGIRAEQASGATTGDIIVTTGTNSTIISDGVQAEGIHAYMGSESYGGVASSGNVIVNAGGRITTHGNTLAEGIYGAITHSQATGNVDITLGGTIQTTGTGGSGNRGILARQYGSGDVIVRHLGDNIQTAGNNAYGIEVGTGGTGTDGGVSASVGDVGVLVAGSINTFGVKAHGVFVNVQNNANAIEVVNSGYITVRGNDTSGIRVNSTGSGDILVRHEAGASITSEGTNTADSDTERTDAIYVVKSAGATGAITVIANGDITTDGANRATGVHAAHLGDGDVFVGGSGNITTTATNNAGTSVYSHGMVALTSAGANGNATVSYETGTVTTGGDNAVALYAASSGASGNALVENNAGTLTTSGTGSHGMYVSNTTTAGGTASATNLDGTITTTGTGAHGIYATSAQGKITVSNTDSAITTSGQSAHAVYARINNAGIASDDMLIEQTGGTFETAGYDSHGIFALTNAASGDIDVTMTDTVMTLKNGNSDGIDIQSQYTGASNVNINVTTNGGEINLVDPAVAATAGANYGIVVLQRYGASSGNITITNNGTNISTGLAADGTSTNSTAIHAAFSDNAASSGNIEIFNSGTLSTQGTNANGIYGGSVGTGDITITNTGDITAADGRGIYAAANTGDVLVTASGNITTGQATATTHNHGIDAGSNSGKTEVEFSNGTIKVVGTNTGGGNAIGIAAWDRGSTNSSVQAYINLGAGAVIDATEGVLGLQIRSNGTGQIDIASGAQVHGGLLGGVQLTGTGTGIGTYTLNNAGEIDAMSDLAVLSSAPAGSTLSITNDGTITGYLRGGAEDTTFTNNSSNSWNLRNFADTDGDGVRDTKAVAVSDFGAGNDTYINTATGTLRLAAVSGETTTVTTGEYIPAGALSSSNAGIVHGQLLNLNCFENAGTIDLSANGLAGDVLVITGGTTPGTDGGGLYISNGGSLIVDTHLNEGGVNSLSDVLVVDNVQMGSGATRIIVNPMIGSTGGLTIDDGIKIVEVMGTQDAGSFVLDAPVTYGAFEYILVQGTLPGNESHWHLQNYDTTSSNNNWWWDWANRALWNPNIGSYLGNQYAAATMFNQNILDRRDSTRSPDQTIWMRSNYNRAQSDILNGKQEVTIKTGLLQIGADLIQQDNLVAGVYAGYGHSDIDNKSRQTGTSADGKVNGYQVGVYGSWLPDNNVGLFADVWAYYAWYDNKLSGAAQYSTTKYDSTGYALSGEIGYGFELCQQENGRSWILEPHAQLIYTHIDADDFYDSLGTWYSSNKGSGIQTRLGARLYGQNAPGQHGVNPFIEANWLHNNLDSGVSLNGYQVSSDIGKNVGEVKIGLQGQVTDRLSVWGHVGAQRGSESFERYEFQLGLGWQW